MSSFFCSSFSALNYVSQLLNNDSVIATVFLSVADRTKGHKSPRSNMSLMLMFRVWAVRAMKNALHEWCFPTTGEMGWRFAESISYLQPLLPSPFIFKTGTLHHAYQLHLCTSHISTVSWNLKTIFFTSLLILVTLVKSTCCKLHRWYLQPGVTFRYSQATKLCILPTLNVISLQLFTDVVYCGIMCIRAHLINSLSQNFQILLPRRCPQTASKLLM